MEVDSSVSQESLSVRLKKHAKLSVARCYQCGKCTAGCPLGDEMDFPPSRILRMLQTGQPDEDKKVLASLSIWLCLSCETCHARCPQEVDFPRIMDFLRSESLRQKTIHPQAKNILAFHKSFLDSVRFSGRLYEMCLIAEYKARTWRFFQDLLLAPKMFLLGKLKLLPDTIKDKKSIFRIFSKTGG